MNRFFSLYVLIVFFAFNAYASSTLEVTLVSEDEIISSGVKNVFRLTLKNDETMFLSSFDGVPSSVVSGDSNYAMIWEEVDSLLNVSFLPVNYAKTLNDLLSCQKHCLSKLKSSAHHSNLSSVMKSFDTSKQMYVHINKDKEVIVIAGTSVLDPEWISESIFVLSKYSSEIAVIDYRYKSNEVRWLASGTVYKPR